MLEWLTSKVYEWYTILYRLFKKKNVKILILGLDNAGKTTLLELLKCNRISTHIPTTAPNHEELNIFGVKISAFDLGGHKAARALWDDYLVNVDGVVFMIDSADRLRLFEARDELYKLTMIESLRNVPILIMGNKVDLPRAMSESELFNLLQLSQSNSYLRKIFMCSVTQKYNHTTGIKWLVDAID